MAHFSNPLLPCPDTVFTNLFVLSVSPSAGLPTSAAKFLTPNPIRQIFDLFHSFPLVRQSQFHLLLVFLLPLVGGGKENFGITERICEVKISGPPLAFCESSGSGRGIPRSHSKSSV
jgi:hypothetical protein